LGFTSYIKGDWKIARTYLKKCLEIKPNDGPARVIVNFMKESDNNPWSIGWEGYRKLDEK
jgi:hypothetical protein